MPQPGQKKADQAGIWASMLLPAEGDFRYELYAGPMEYSRLAKVGHDFDDVNPYGWPGFRTIIRPVAVAVRWLLVWMHDNLHLAYGMVLVLFGILVRIVLWPLNQKAMRSTMAMQAIQPELKAIQDKYKEDPQRLQQEMFKLYKEHNVNPLGGCWPMLLPMPVLLALFFVFQNTIELRGQSFLWLPDLSRPDPLYIIPLIMGLSMFWLTKMGQRGIPPNPQMKMMMYVMPIMMTVLFLNFASGLNLYYAVSNLASVPQQWLISQERMKLAALREGEREEVAFPPCSPTRSRRSPPLPAGPRSRSSGSRAATRSRSQPGWCRASPPRRRRTAQLASFVDGDGTLIDRGLYTAFPGPHSYTGEDLVEFSCHGGLVVPVRLLAALLAAGARAALPGEFTRRAVLNGRMDLLQAEAVGDLIDATAAAQARSALRQLDGGLSRRLAELRGRPARRRVTPELRDRLSGGGRRTGGAGADRGAHDRPAGADRALARHRAGGRAAARRGPGGAGGSAQRRVSPHSSTRCSVPTARSSPNSRARPAMPSRPTRSSSAGRCAWRTRQALRESTRRGGAARRGVQPALRGGGGGGGRLCEATGGEDREAGRCVGRTGSASGTVIVVRTKADLVRPRGSPAPLPRRSRRPP